MATRIGRIVADIVCEGFSGSFKIPTPSGEGPFDRASMRIRIDAASGSKPEIAKIDLELSIGTLWAETERHEWNDSPCVSQGYAFPGYNVRNNGPMSYCGALSLCLTAHPLADWPRWGSNADELARIIGVCDTPERRLFSICHAAAKVIGGSFSIKRVRGLFASGYDLSPEEEAEIQRLCELAIGLANNKSHANG
jgi:hypothetical protein